MVKILYVEDNEDNLYMLSNRLKRRGYEVVSARDGEQGIAMAASEAPALILMDLSLPVMDGWEATRRLKAEPRTQNIPVIALSAHAMAGDRFLGRSIGGHGSARDGDPVIRGRDTARPCDANDHRL